MSPRLFKRIIRFSIIGGLSTSINYFLFYVFYMIFEFHYSLSSSFGYVVGLFFGYYFNKYWTFFRKVDLKKTYTVKYVIAQILGLLFCQISLFIFVNFFAINVLISNILALGIASIISFLIIDTFVFYNHDDNNIIG